MKQTISWIGSVHQQEDILAKLAEHYRVLLVRKEGSAICAPNQRQGSEVEVVDGVKDGCWEADIIVLAEEEIQEELLGKIREVTTQKLVLVVNLAGSEEKWFSRVQKSLPSSKIVAVTLYSHEAALAGENPQAVETATGIVRLFQDIRHKKTKIQELRQRYNSWCK